jgi:predicted metal-binding membrane protein
MAERAVERGLVATLLAGAALAWGITANRMQGMEMGPGTDLGGLGWFAGVWVVMMAGMMLPSVAPAVVVEARAQRTGSTVPFVVGYLAAWAAAGLVGYVLVEGVRSLDLGFLEWGRAGAYVAGGVIVAAAVYQLTPLKDACLRRCRQPLTQLADPRPGALGALRAGLEHGGFCVGCCWALMAVLFAVGVMSVTWMVVVAVLIGVEKLLPWKAVANRGIALFLLALGLAVAFTPESVPGLTVPSM